MTKKLTLSRGNRGRKTGEVTMVELAAQYMDLHRMHPTNMSVEQKNFVLARGHELAISYNE